MYLLETADKMTLKIGPECLMFYSGNQLDVCQSSQRKKERQSESEKGLKGGNRNGEQD
jgi:hypothetical protein